MTQKTKKPKLICIVGPTGSGKTEWGIELARKFNGEVVSADSRQIYKGMDIGTGKPVPDNRQQTADSRKKTLIQGIGHHLIDVVNPDQQFSVVDYKTKAVEAIKNIQARNKLPFLVGGTGLYIAAVVYNYQFPEVKPDKKLRETLQEKSLTQLQKMLKKMDPQSAQKIDIQNKKRLIRAIEVAQKTGRSFVKAKTTGPLLFDALQMGIKVPRSKLYKTIDKRVDKMFAQGLEKEVKTLVKKYGWNSVLSQTIGYQEFQGYFEKQDQSLAKIKEKIKTHTRQYAKRQLTWFKKDKNIVWIEHLKKAAELVDKFLSTKQAQRV